jgi:hypothetical protein
MWWRDFRSIWSNPSLAIERWDRAYADRRLDGDAVLFRMLCDGQMPEQIRPIIRSAWAFDDVTGEPVDNSYDGIYHVFVFCRSDEMIGQINAYIQEKCSTAGTGT